MSITVPLGVTVNKEILQGCQVYVFRHCELGQLGRIVMQPLPNGHTHFASEVSGDPEDPMTARRRVLFVPLCEQVIDEMETTLGKGSLDGALPPPSPKGPTEVIESKRMPCETCGADVAMLIFADDATNPGRFEDCARKMHHQYTKLDVPTWIIGPPIGKLAQSQTPTQVMKVWPAREAIVTTTADEFNEELDALLDSHCA